MVAVDHTKYTPDRIRSAANVAKVFDALLVGVRARLVDIPIGAADMLAYTYPDLERGARDGIDALRLTLDFVASHAVQG